MQDTKTENNTSKQSVISKKTWLSIIVALTIGAVGVLTLNLNRYNLPPFSDQVAAQASPAAPESTTSTTTQAIDPTQFPSTDDLEELVSLDNNSWLAARQENFRFTLSGEVPDQETKALIETAMRETYGNFSLTNITVNPSVLGGSWFESSPSLIKTFASQIIDGGFALRNGRLHFEGQVANDANVSTLQGMSTLPGMPQSIEATLEVTGLRNPAITATRRSDKLFLLGFVPSQEIADEIATASEDLYGAENVSNNLSVDDTTFAPFAIARWQENLTAFFPFGEYKIEIKGGSFSGELRGGLAFSPSSSDLTPQGEAFLEVFPSLVNRSNGQISVVGHTDNSGTFDTNLELSQQRAEAVGAFLTENGISEDRIVAVGKGDTEPTASNATEEGRQLNRRVEVKWVI